MSSDTTTKHIRLLHTFDAQRLGEGDISGGANVIAAMACAIANIHRHVARIASGEGPSFRIGSSVLAEYQSNLDQSSQRMGAGQGGTPGKP